MRLASSVPLSIYAGPVPKSTWTLGVVLTGLLAVGLPIRAVRADTTLNSGTTTVTTGTNFGWLTVASTGTAVLEVLTGGFVTSAGNSSVGLDTGSFGTVTVSSSGTWNGYPALFIGDSGRAIAP